MMLHQNSHDIARAMEFERRCLELRALGLEPEFIYAVLEILTEQMGFETLATLRFMIAQAAAGDWDTRSLRAALARPSSSLTDPGQ